MKLFLHKISHYEYWNFWFLYFPLIPLFLYYCAKAKSFAYITSVNPGIKWGGLLGYSKFDLTKQINPNRIPKTEIFESNALEDITLKYPIILKPDMGERGKGVEKIENEQQKKEYLKNNKSKDIIVQEFIDFPCEYGLFYARLPNEEKGKILSITAKDFLKIIGDGKTTLEDLLEKQARAKGRLWYLKKKHQKQLNTIPKTGEKIILEPIGNHNRGTIFLDASHLVNPRLENALDQIAKEIKGFYYGRFDVKAKSEKELMKGDFVVLEVNGCNSEATHIYHPGKFSLLEAYQDVARHLAIQFDISEQNKIKGFTYTKTKDLAYAIFKHIFVFMLMLNTKI